MSTTAKTLPAVPRGWTPPRHQKTQTALYFTRTVGFEHSVVCRNGGLMSWSEMMLSEMGERVGLDVECTKDGRVFEGDLDPYDCFVFYTLGDLTRQDKRYGTPPMSPEGKQRLLEAIASGKPLVGFHAAADTFYGDGVDPYVEMIGAEFCGHGLEQEAGMLVRSPDFPGLEGLPASFRLFEEWYVFKKISRDMHVILALETAGMKGNVYDRPPLPATWARMYGKGRVFYTSLGHREDLWGNPIFQQIAYAGLAWAMGNVDADVTPNFDEATPKGDQYRRVPVEPGSVSR
jgi:type 1 glutamine amidotransferase